MSLEPIKVEAVIDRPCAEVFEAFLSNATDWWPLESHSVGPHLGEPVPEQVVIERHEGGRIFEVSPAGEHRLWGVIHEFNDGKKLSFSWHPGMDEALATRVTVAFQAVDNRKTLVTLRHEGWNDRGAEATMIRENYVSGWKNIIDVRFRKFVENK
ncbi:MAG: SRPBCC domain-containing protein [Sulfitobacter sp.]